MNHNSKPSISRWLDWWNGRSLFARVFPTVLYVGYWSALIAVGGAHTDLFIATTTALVLYYGGPLTKPVFQFLLPFALMAILYDSQRYYADAIRGPIHVREPYEFDKTFFGISTSQGVLTPNEWWQLHTHPILDLFTGVAYIIFIPVFIFCCAYFRFWASRKGTKTCAAWSIRARSPQVTWTFFFVNVIGMSTYYWYAASPPWYVALYGFGHARTDIPANLAGCVRFDELIGIPIFHSFYSRSADVHGAIPSLHVSYPLIACYYAFRFGALRVFTSLFLGLMCFSAVYLNHHYIIDVLLGLLYAAVVVLSTDLVWNWRMKQQPNPEYSYS